MTIKKIRLIKSALSEETINAIAQETLNNGGFVAALVQPNNPEIGDRMPDGSLYAGTSPDTGKEMYAAPADAPLTMTFNESADYVKKINQEKYLGHDDWRVPRRIELEILFNYRAAIGGFNVTGSRPSGWYWAAAPDSKWAAWCQRFRDGAQSYDSKDDRSSVRLVRMAAHGEAP